MQSAKNQKEPLRYPGLSEFCQNLAVDLRALGLEAQLMSFAAFTSSQRATMFQTSHIKQAVLVNGAELSRILTGAETLFGNYQFDETKRLQNIQVLAAIPKFKVGIGIDHIKVNPTTTIIFLGLEDGIVDYFDITSYRQGHDGFGYMNTIHNVPRGMDLIGKDIELVSTPNKSGNMYCQGLNANIVYLPMEETTADAVVISEGFAEKLKHTGIKSLEINVPKEHIPLNLYGDDKNFKIWPDVGEHIGEDGIVCGFRSMKDSQYGIDLSWEELSHPNYSHDILYQQAHPGAEIIDIQIFVNGSRYNQIKREGDIFKQLQKYQEQHSSYYEEIHKTYQEVKHSDREISDRFSDLVTRCLGRVSKTPKGERITLTSKGGEAINNFHLSITYKYERSVGPGDKLTGPEGAKGVISEVWPDAYMPKDQQNFVAEIIAGPTGPFNRMNVGQWYSQFITRGSELFKQRLSSGLLGNDDEAWKEIMRFIDMINPEYAVIVKRNTKDKQELLEAVRKYGIYLVIPPFLKTLSEQLVEELEREFDIGESPVTFTKVFRDGPVEITTKYPAMIGSKLIYLLGKVPLDQLSSISSGYVSQFYSPMKVKSRDLKSQHPHKQTPQRIGEDEVSVLSMSKDTDVVQRLMATHANCPQAIDKLQYRLLTDINPTQIDQLSMTTKEMRDSSNNIGILKQLLGAVGIKISTVMAKLTKA